MPHFFFEDVGAAFGQLVRNARKDRGWTQDRLRQEILDATEGGVRYAQSAISRMEAGDQGIDLADAVILAYVLGFDVNLRDLIAPIEEGEVEDLRAAHAAALAEYEMTREHMFHTMTAFKEAEEAKEQALATAAAARARVTMLEASLVSLDDRKHGRRGQR